MGLSEEDSKTYLKSTAESVEQNRKEQQNATRVHARCIRGQVEEDTSKNQRDDQVTTNSDNKEQPVTQETLVPTRHAEPDLHGHGDGVR